MTIVKYILKKWMALAFITFAILVLLVAIAEIITDIMMNSGTLSEFIIKFFIFLPIHFDKIFPVTVIIASFLLVQNLRDKNELLGVLISGFTFGQIITVISLAAITVGIMQFLASAYLGPLLWEKRRDILVDGDQKFRGFYNEDMFSKSYISGKMWYKNDKYLLSFVYLDKVKKELIKPTVYFYQDKLAEVIVAEKVKFLPSGNNYWIFENGEVWKITSEYPEIEKFEQEERKMEESFNDFGQLEVDIKTLGFDELVEYVRGLKKLSINVSEIEVTMYEKIAASIPTIAFALLPLFGIFNITRRGSNHRYLIKIFIMIFTYWLGCSYFAELGRYGRINSIVAAFSIQIIVLLGVVYFLIRRVYKC